MIECNYASNGYLVVTTKVQANPIGSSNPSNFLFPFGISPFNEEMSHRSPSPLILTSPTGTPSTSTTMVAANRPLVVPMSLSITDIVVKGILKLTLTQKVKREIENTPKNFLNQLDYVVSLHWMNDPLQSVLVSSSFDSLPKVKENLQNDIESRIRSAILHDLPQFIYMKSLGISPS